MQRVFSDNKNRCAWVPSDDELYITYHDEEWGQPQRDKRQLFEMLCLEGAQAGLSWITILRRRQDYRQAFDAFDPYKIAAYGQTRIDELLNNPGIIRNRLKVAAFIGNAQAYIKLEDSGVDFSDYIWNFVAGQTLAGSPLDQGMAIAGAMSKDLKKRGFAFCGPTVCYAFMQACGLVDDHDVTCFKYTASQAEATISCKDKP